MDQGVATEFVHQARASRALEASGAGDEPGRVAVRAQMDDEGLEVFQRERPAAATRADRRDERVVAAEAGHSLGWCVPDKVGCGAAFKGAGRSTQRSMIALSQMSALFTRAGDTASLKTGRANAPAVRWLVALFLLATLAPSAAAVSFEADLEDPRGDVEIEPGWAGDSATTDVLRFSSRVNGTTVEQRVVMRAAPDPELESILIRNWFRNSTNGSFYVIDLELFAGPPDVPERFQPITRRGAYENATPIEATYALEGATWIFRFDASVAPDAECFLPIVFAYRSHPRVSDTLGMGGRPCETAPEPEPTDGETPEETDPEATTDVAPDAVPAEVPGSRSPALGLSIVGALLVIALLLALRRR